MRRTGGNALPRNLVIILTAIAVMISFSLAAAEPLRAADFALMERTGSLAGGAWYSFPQQAGDPVVFTKAEDTRFSPLRAESQRFFAPFGMSGSGNTLCSSRFRTNSKCGFVSIKETILLKLRI